jgi:hypothetical protein
MRFLAGMPPPFPDAAKRIRLPQESAFFELFSINLLEVKGGNEHGKQSYLHGYS